MPRKRWGLETSASWFLLVAALDAVFTYIALRLSAVSQGSVRIVESNPIAAWVISEYGYQGMFVFKLLMSVLVIVIATVIDWYRPWVARALLWGGTLVIGAVVVHTVRLMLAHRV
ncbi:MAG: DUF5658 family protein [Planctomycetaceae bacterium]